MGLFFKKEKLGYKKEKLAPAKIKNGVAISKLVGYKFTLPKNFEFEDLQRYNAKYDYSITEFSALDAKTSTRIGVLLTEPDLSKVKEMLPSWSRMEPVIASSILKKMYQDVRETDIVQREFMGLPCYHYKGYLQERPSFNGIPRYRECYMYLAPYMNVTFFVVTTDEHEYETTGLLKFFEDTKSKL
ncbi:MAG: hypothetical protein MJ166_06160 [Clostridia bacterium]|nr:hypothetical protein [Clostridia bacterium]